MRWFGILLFLIAGGGATAADAPEVRDKHVAVALIPEVTSIAPGESFTVAVRLRIDDHWHAYWRNPGDSGMPTSVEWDLPPGLVAGALRWPTPDRIEVGGIISYGYHGEVWLLTDITVSERWEGTEAVLRAKVLWLMCKEECIPGEASVEARLPRGDGRPDPARTETFSKARASMPLEARTSNLAISAYSTEDKKGIILRMTPSQSVAPPEKAYFFAEETALIDHGKTQDLLRLGNSRDLRLSLSPAAEGIPTRLRGVLALEGGPKGPGAFDIDEAVLRSPPPRVDGGPKQAKGEDVPLGMALLFAFIGGLVLNVMPCVLPVISLKIFSFMRQAGDRQAIVIVHSVVFSIGVVASFLALAGLLLALRAAGQAIGWGFQFQSPMFVAAMCALVFVLSLSLFGVFMIGGSLMGAGAGLTAREGPAGSFFSGVLATTLATPCTAPFMGTALGFAIAQPAAVTLLVFAALGAGMAAPYLILAAHPALLKRLPRPGPWMEVFKQATGFLMMGTAVWLLWVFGATRSTDAVMRLVAYLLLLGFGCWVIGQFTGPAHRAAARALAWTTGIIIAVGGWIWLVTPTADMPGEGMPSAQKTKGIVWVPYSRAALEELLLAGKPVFVDFTAEWCLTCKVNERVALAPASTVALFREHGVVAMKADWTAKDPEITRALESFGRSGVPLYVYYAAGKRDDPMVLPGILTPGIVRRAIEGAGKPTENP